MWWTIGRKILVGHLIILAGFAAAVAWVLADLRRMDEFVSLAADAQEQVIAINGIAEDVAAILRARGTQVSMLQMATVGGAESSFDSLGQAIRDRREHEAALVRRVEGSRFGARRAIRDGLTDLRTATKELDDVFDEAERLSRMGMADAAERMFVRWHEPNARLEAALARLRQQAQADARALVATSVDIRRRLIWRSGAILGGTLLFVVGIVLVLARSIRRSTRQLSHALAAAAEGDFQQRAEMAGRDEFQELAEGFNAMCRRLGELDELKADFVSNVSHELRTPIASLKQASMLLAEGIPGPLNDEQREILGIVESNTGRLAALINDLLDAAKIEAGRLQIDPEPVDLPELIRRAVRSLAPLATEKHLRVTMRQEGTLPRALADPLRMEQVLTNLLGNAVKFTPEGGEISFLCERDGAMVRCSVRDTGVGIPAAELPRIFDKFHQVRATRTNRTKGTGLGLTIVKYLVELHGGTISVESAEGRGTTFTFTIPTVDDDRPDVSAPEERHVPLTDPDDRR